MSEFHRRWDEIVERLSAQGISESERANLRAELRSLAEEWGEHSWAEWRKHAEKISAQFPFMAFREPDFEALYEQKADLDRRLLDRDDAFTVAPSRRWFAFSLRTLFVVVTICAIVALSIPALIAKYREWERDRGWKIDGTGRGKIGPFETTSNSGRRSARVGDDGKSL